MSYEQSSDVCLIMEKKGPNIDYEEINVPMREH
jgi:hypothetical protein